MQESKCVFVHACVVLDVCLTYILLCVCFRRDHHYSLTGQRAEVGVYPYCQSSGWRGGATAKNWHCHGNPSSFSYLFMFLIVLKHLDQT